MNNFQYNTPRYLLFGTGCRKEIKNILGENSIKKVLVVTDKDLSRLGVAAKITAVLEESNLDYVLFDSVKPNPTVDIVNAGVELYKSEGCDGLISIGGGSPHDAAKAIGIVIANGGSITDYSKKPITKDIPPLIAVNTTAGTGSEVTHSCVITDEAVNNKFGMKSIHMLPHTAVNDYELMFTMPKSITAGTGMDALTHAIEAHVSLRANLVTEQIGLSAIRLVFDNLPGAVADGNNEDKRGGMAAAATLAGLAFGNASVGVVHSMSHQLSAVYDLPHGLCNAIILPVGMRFNADNSETAKTGYAEIAEAIFSSEAAGKSTDEKCDLLIAKVEELSAEVGTKIPLTTLGVKTEDIPLLAEKTLLDGSIGNNPVKPTAKQIEELFTRLMEGA